MQNTIILCEKCEGRGYTRHSELTNHHKGEYDDWIDTCWSCQGSGRQVKTHTIKLEPFIPAREEELGRK